MNNTKERLHKVFFYGLYMDEEILKSKGVEPREKILACAKGYKLRVGKMATLLRDENSNAYGIVYSLTYEEIDKLYKDSGLTNYVAEAVMVKTEDKEQVATLCCILLNPPAENESNYTYFESLVKCMDKYNLPIPE
ncbi:gamma-glutamylcyclotransferase [Arcobacter sp. CECT 8989]|uniref:gamma-glutamylcyclotransferase family protein n=1 Tax=Arcobacter sp. CECT 8989 TaxID=2044509 RepID=UPI00100BD87D|nr:gamma-glutamylcyclotransferase family protein [Arcobacter sp. CECT 8989]RXJ98937.1 gamma-glutamylcyclotransferase [Arcobacter sp. CECT 8989]